MNIIKRLPTNLVLLVFSYDDTYRKKYSVAIVYFRTLQYKKRYYEFTEYPQIFCKSYWGMFCHYINSVPLCKGPPTEIIRNRNRFVKEYNVVKYQKPRRDLKNEILSSDKTDHNEYYIDTENKYIHVFSVYYNCDNINYDGYTKIFPLYTLQSVTFIKHLPHLKPQQRKTKKAKTQT